MNIDLTTFADDVNFAEEFAAKMSPVFFLIPGIAPYAAAIVAAIPQIIKATNVLEQAVGIAVGTEANTQAVADHINPEKPANPVLTNAVTGTATVP